MAAKVTSAIEVLRDEGPVSLAKKTSVFLAGQTPQGRRWLYEKTKEQLRDRMAAEEDLGDVLDTVLDVKPGYPPYQPFVMQLRDEIEALTELVEAEQPRTVLEIGTAKGGSFYIWSRHLDSVDKLVSVDLPGGRFGGGYDERAAELFRQFAPDKRMEFVRADSHRTATFEAVADLVDEGVDFLFIDGDHTYEGVKRDFEMYSELVADGGLIALHDILPHPEEKAAVDRRRETVDDIEERHLSWGQGHPDCNVDRLWTELVAEYDTEEIISHPKQTWGGIGVVRP